MRWRVGIRGPEAIVRLLAIGVSDQDIRLVADRGGVILVGSTLDSLSDLRSVRHEAERIVTILSGAARILLGSTEPLEVTDVTDAGADASNVVDLQTGEARDRRRPSFRTMAERARHPDAWSQSSLFRSLREALSDEAIEKALQLRDTVTLEWAALVRICEIVEAAATGRRAVAASSISKASIRRLYDAASAVPGAEAAPPRRPVATLPPPDPMTLAEARWLVDHLLLTWIGSATRHSARKRRAQMRSSR
jgi:hypothetical protein